MLFDLGVVLEKDPFAGITDLYLFIQPIRVDASSISNQLFCRILILVRKHQTWWDAAQLLH